MIFGDEPRFQKSAVAHPLDRQIHGFAKLETDAHVGPGVYFSNGEEEKRNGWKSRSFSKREPMTPSKSPSSRNDHYTAGVVTSYGALASPLSPRERSYPGPGHYDGDLMTSFSSKSGSPTKRSSPSETVPGLSRSGSKMDLAPRFSLEASAVMKDGVIFRSRENNDRHSGSGYFPQTNDLLKKSHNKRVQQPKAPSPLTGGRVPITDIRQTFGTPGSSFRTPQPQQRPRSASASPVNRNKFSFSREDTHLRSPY